MQISRWLTFPKTTKLTFLSGECTAETPSRCPSRCSAWGPRRWREFGTGGPLRPGPLTRYRPTGTEERPPRGLRARPGRCLPEAARLMSGPVRNYPNCAPSPQSRWPAPQRYPPSSMNWPREPLSGQSVSNAVSISPRSEASGGGRQEDRNDS